MSSFGKNVFLKTLNNEAEPDPNPPIIPDPLTINQLNVNQIGDNSNPCETIHVASTFLYRGDISYIDNTDVNNQREFMKLQTDGDLNLVNNINFYDFILNNPASKSKFSIGLDELDSSFEIKSLDPVSQTRLKIGDSGINEWTFMQLTLDIEPLGAGVLLNNGPLILNTGDITLNSGKFIGDGSLLQNLPYPAENQSLQNVCDISPITTTNITASSFIGDGSQLTNLPVQLDTLQDVTTRGSTTTTNDISFTGTGKFTINQEECDGNLFRIRAGTAGDGLVSIGESTQNDGFTNAERSVLIGRNSGAFNCLNDSICIGSGAGNNQCKAYVVNVGDDAGQNFASTNSVNIGKYAGEYLAGENSINIGALSGQNSIQSPTTFDNTIILNASGVELNAGVNNSCYIRPIRQTPDAPSESHVLFYDTSSNEVRFGPISASGGIPSLSQVLAVGNTGGNINLTGDIDATSAILTNSLNFSYTSATSSITSLGIPLTTLTNAYTASLPTSPVPHTGDVFTFENSTGATISAGDIVQFDDDFTNINGVKIYAASASQSNQNCMPIGVCVQNSTTGSSAFICTKGFTTCKALDGNYVKGQMLGCSAGGSVISSQITTNNVGIIGVCMESKTITTPGSGILVWIKPDFKL